MTRMWWIAGWLFMVGVVGCAPGGALDVATQERGCATVGACINTTSMRGCTSSVSFSAERLRCLAGASTCEAAYDCFGASLRPDLPCATASTSCEGSTRVVCNDGSFGPAYTARIDCAFEGNTCVSDGTGNTFCGVGNCTTPGVRCAGNDVITCSGGVELRDVCPAGTACDATQERCVVTGPACTADRCEWDTLVYCDGGREGRADCASQGQSCTIRDGFGSCDPTGSECDDTFTQRCVGSELEYCGPNDTIERFDCAGAGFSGCGGSPVRCTVSGFSPLG